MKHSNTALKWVKAEEFIRDCLNENNLSVKNIIDGLQLIFEEVELPVSPETERSEEKINEMKEQLEDLNTACEHDIHELTEERDNLKDANEDAIELIRESRNLHVLCTLIDKSGQCDEMVSKIDKFLKTANQL